VKTLVIVPSRGRPRMLQECIAAVNTYSQGDTRVAVALDDDDPEFDRYFDMLTGKDNVLAFHGQRRSLTAWTNEIAVNALAGDRPDFFVSMGDDHHVRTPGWDVLLAANITDLGGTGVVYPDDMRRTDIPECVMLSADIVRELGWMCMPQLRHFYVDNVWADLGNGAGCLRFAPRVVVEHMHWERGGSEHDLTYLEAESRMEADRLAYEAWCLSGREADVAKVRALRAARM
jgi:hypothetical protein